MCWSEYEITFFFITSIMIFVVIYHSPFCDAEIRGRRVHHKCDYGKRVEVGTMSELNR